MTKRPPDYDSPLAWLSIEVSVAELKKGSTAHVEPIISFLEKDPYVHGSGYVKEKIWHYLSRVSLTDKQKERLREVALRYVTTRLSREFFPMCRFISGIATEKFQQQVQVFVVSPNARTKQRATLLQAYFESISHGESVRVNSLLRDRRR